MSYNDLCIREVEKKAIANYNSCVQSAPKAYPDLIQKYLAPSVGCAPTPQECKVPKKRNSAMYHDEDCFDDGFDLSLSAGATETERQKRFLLNELSGVEDRQETKLRKQYGLMDDDEPRTFNELMARLKDGKYFIPDDKKDKDAWGYGLNLVKWRDPAVKEDQKGFEAAQKIMRVSYTDAIRTIKISDPKEGLAALKSFESATFQ